MQTAVDVVHYSEHTENKIAACLVGTDQTGNMFFRVGTNFWPDLIKEKIGKDTRIGNASGTVHAETACLIAAPQTNESSVFITDPPCPNCVKNMAEAGIKDIYIDHKGFDKKWAKDRNENFEKISLPICAAAGIGVYKVFRKEQNIETLVPPNPSKNEKPGNHFHIRKIDHNNFDHALNTEIEHYSTSQKPFAVALAHTPDQIPYLISAQLRLWPNHGQTVDPNTSKYSFFVNPVKRVMMIAKREGLTIKADSLYSNTIPTAREMIDMIGADLTKIEIDNIDEARFESDAAALHLLADKNILNYRIKHPATGAADPR